MMLSSGFASRTRKSALLPACDRADVGKFQHLRRGAVAATMTCAGVIPAATISCHLDVMGPGHVAVRSEGDANTGGIEPRQVARLDAERLLNGRTIGRRRLEFRQLAGGHAVAQPAQVVRRRHDRAGSARRTRSGAA